MWKNEFLEDEAIFVMWSAPNARDKIKGAYVVVSTNHATFRTNRFSRLISLPTSNIFASGTSDITTILKYRSVNPIIVTSINAANSGQIMIQRKKIEIKT